VIHQGRTLERLVSWEESYAGVVRRRVDLTYAPSGGFTLPATLRRETVQGGETRGCTLRFLDWRLKVDASERFPP
jgi:hypothetical protein